MGEGASVEVAADRHSGSTGAHSTGNVYSLVLREYSPQMRYQIVADVRGTRPQDQKPATPGAAARSGYDVCARRTGNCK